MCADPCLQELPHHLICQISNFITDVVNRCFKGGKQWERTGVAGMWQIFRLLFFVTLSSVDLSRREVSVDLPRKEVPVDLPRK